MSSDVGPSGAAPPVLVVMVGLPGVGKTHRAMELEAELGALRLTPDEWMIPLYGDPVADGRRYVVEGRLLWVARRALSLGVSVILDFGLWVRDERRALRAFAGSYGAEFRMVHLQVERDLQVRRLQQRSPTAGHTTFTITEDEMDEYNAMFEAVSDDELEDTVAPPPEGFAGWDDWIAEQWPSSDVP